MRLRLLLVALVLLSGCARKSRPTDDAAFSIVGVVTGYALEPRQTIDGRVQQVVLKVETVKEGVFNYTHAYRDYEEGKSPPMPIGARYLLKGFYGNHGIIYTSIVELK